MVALDIMGEPDVEQMIIQDGSCPVNLGMHIAEVSGAVKVAHNGCSQGWKDTESSAAWTFRLHAPGDYQVTAITRASQVNPERFGNHGLRLSISGATASATVGVQDLDLSEAAPWTQAVRSEMGTVRIANAGVYTVRVCADRIDADATNGP